MSFSLSVRLMSRLQKMIKLTEVVCGVGNVLQNKGGIGAYVRVDRTTFLFVAAHLAAHQVSRTCYTACFCVCVCPSVGESLPILSSSLAI